MMLKHRRAKWTDGSSAANDFSVIDERGKNGRIYRTLAVDGGHAWNWTVYGIAVKSPPSAGRAPTLEAAQAAFEAAWATCIAGSRQWQ
jgi:hypothetical protein